MRVKGKGHGDLNLLCFHHELKLRRDCSHVFVQYVFTRCLRYNWLAFIGYTSMEEGYKVWG